MKSFVNVKARRAERLMAVKTVSFVVVILAVLVSGIYYMGNIGSEQGIKLTREAAVRTAVQCYSIEGIYPPNVDYMEANYKLKYDKSKYYIHYDAFASNIMPTIEVYKNIAERNLNSFELRTSLSYVKTKINQYDEVGKIAIKEENGLKMLVLSEEVEGEIFDTSVYFYKGKLYEITGARGMKFKPEDGFSILSVDSFEISEKDGLVKLVTTDDDGSTETLYVKLRTA